MSVERCHSTKERTKSNIKAAVYFMMTEGNHLHLDIQSHSMSGQDRERDLPSAHEDPWKYVLLQFPSILPIPKL
jgi:hypothetical protein